MKRTPLQRGTSKLSRGKPLSKGTVGLTRGSKLKSRPKSPEEKQQQSEDIERQWAMFMEIWEDREHYSEVSNTWLGNECKTLYMHHIWPKSKYPALKYVKWNIIQLTADEHQMVENDMYRYPEVNKRREELRKKYDL